VDQNGVVLDILVQDRRDGAAAKRFFKRLLHELRYKPRRLITDGLRSYGVAQRALLPGVRRPAWSSSCGSAHRRSSACLTSWSPLVCCAKPPDWRPCGGTGDPHRRGRRSRPAAIASSTLGPR
jgi:hypothetical protein